MEGRYFEVFLPFVACFCEDGDLLSQWRGYGADAAGFSVAFDTSELPTGLAHAEGALKRTEPFLVKVEYERDTQIALVDQTIDLVLEEIERANAEWKSLGSPEEWLHFPPEEPLTPVSSVYEDIAVLISALALRFKSKGFSEEHEWRIVQLLHKSESVKTRVARGGLVPYVEIDLPDRPIRQIRVGPRQQRAQSGRNFALDQLLRNNGYDPAALEVRPSAISYR